MRIILQGFILIDDDNDGILESIGLDIQESDGIAKIVVTTKPGVLSFFQQALDAYLGK